MPDGTENDTLDVMDVLGPSGIVARRLKCYEERPQQLEMAQAVEAAIRDGQHLIVEAGTGVGKSFAYLVPAILRGVAERSRSGNKRKPVIVSTHTINLQEQLIGRDIPFLNAVLPLEFSAVLVKGRANYLSRRRLNNALARSASLFGDDRDHLELQQIAAWAARTSDGSRSDLDFRPRASVWDEVQSDSVNCRGRQCTHYDECFYFKARRRIWNADLLVVNHALFFSDLALRRQHASILPDYDVVIFDEAHTIEQVASDHLGIRVTSGQVEYVLRKLYNDRTQRGLLATGPYAFLRRSVNTARGLARDFFADVRQWIEEHAAKKQETTNKQRANENRYAAETVRVRQAPGIADPLTPHLAKLAQRLRDAAEDAPDEDFQLDLRAAADRCDALAEQIDSWLTQRIPECVYWVDTTNQPRPRVAMSCCPIDVGPILKEHLFDSVSTVVMTSATLATARGDFGFFRSGIGVTQAKELQLDSPFDYRKQATLYLAANMPHPKERASFEQRCVEKIRHYVSQTHGRAFVLFTSYDMLRRCADALRPWFTRQNIELLVHGDQLPPSALLERFTSSDAAVIFGTDSFWQGVDVPGDKLQTVIITRLPFRVPTEPRSEARRERIVAKGGNPFIEYQVPEAIIKLKQGFGRLIRRRDDSGQVVILDPRIHTERYGRLFLESLPKCRVVVDED
ncbi:MAG: helicase [Planctomycetota bacterium]|nr:MAG: helicase [Planctomycetota bacterium]